MPYEGKADEILKSLPVSLCILGFFFLSLTVFYIIDVIIDF